MTEMLACPFCEGEITSTAKKCRHCGEWVSRECLGCGTPIRNEWAARGYCAECEEREAGGFPIQPAVGAPQVPAYFAPRKSRTVSIGLSLVLGGLGAHKFYLGKPGVGFLYLLFCWTGIPSVVGLFEAIRYINMDEEEFQQRFLRRDL